MSELDAKEAAMASPMTARKALEITRNPRARYGLDQARAILDALVEAHEADDKCVPDNVHDPRDAFALKWNRDEAHRKLRALERGEEAPRE